mgnify:FL=1
MHQSLRYFLLNRLLKVPERFISHCQTLYFSKMTIDRQDFLTLHLGVISFLLQLQLLQWLFSYDLTIDFFK